MNRPISVFIIDDDLDDQLLMRQAFEATMLPVTVEFVTKSEEAIRYLCNCRPSEQPDIIVSDYNMPMMNGKEFLMRLLEKEQYKQTPKVILSTAASPTIVESCMSNGAFLYLLKPCNFDALVTLAKKILSVTISEPKG